MRLLVTDVTDYDRLREWSGQHRFSMAIVLRALLERFLDEQHAGGSLELA